MFIREKKAERYEQMRQGPPKKKSLQAVGAEGDCDYFS